MSEYRIRKSGTQWWVWQWETGRKYVRVETPHPTRADAHAWIATRT